MEHRKSIPAAGFQDLLTRILSPLPAFGWELSYDPTAQDHDILAFSFVGNAALKSQIVSLIGLPIVMKEWSIRCGVPPRCWDQYFIYTRDDGGECDIDASSWTWNFVERGTKVAIILHASNLPAFNEHELKDVAQIVLAGELGEENIDDYLFSYQLDIEAGNPTEYRSPIQNLRKMFADRFPSASYRTFLASFN